MQAPERSSRRERAAAVLLLLLCVCTAVAGLLTSFPSRSIAAEGSSPALLEDGRELKYSLVHKWMVHWGDLRKEELSAAAEWEPFDEQAWKRMSSYKGVIWIKRDLPLLLPARDPNLFLLGWKQFDVYIDDRLAYRAHPGEPYPRRNPVATISAVNLEPSDAGKEVAIRLVWNGEPFRPGWNVLTTRYDILLSLIRGEWPLALYSAWFLAAGLTALTLFFRRRKESLYLWFGLLFMAAGGGTLLSMQLGQWLFETSATFYWKDLMLPFGMYAFLGFYGAALRLSRSWIYRAMRSLVLLYTAFTFACGWSNSDLYRFMLVDALPYMFIPVFAIVSVTLFRQYRRESRTVETVWLLRAYVLLVLTALFYLAMNTSLQLQEWINLLPWLLYHLTATLLYIGLLLFMVCLAMVLVLRFSEVYRQVERSRRELALKHEELEQFHRSLERLVEVRTQELAQANRSLAASLREKAETLAEVSVLEERNRIAHEIHDVVGHTLTAAIVQLEATKKLAARDLTKAAEKLDTINGLVRKGLDDIRRSVRILKDEGESGPFDLHAALEELIRETEQTMGVSVDADIERLPPDDSLGWLTQRVVYHALMEGLTNGIRHGGCSRFRFRLYRADGRLQFRLTNDGTPFGTARPGFGLTTMMERIQLLGGTAEVGTGPDGVGCELAVTLPLASLADAM